MKTESKIDIKGFLKIWDPDTQEVLVDKTNAIHYENFSYALASSLADRNNRYIHEMHFGNGASTVDPTGVIVYLPTNTSGTNADLYNPTYFKVINDLSTYNNDPTRNKMEIRHVTGQSYTDILITCLLDYGEPSGQDAFDTSTNFNGTFVFDEIGIKGWNGTTVGAGDLLTHVVFNPVQKSLNRLIQIDYTIRIQTLTGFQDNSI
jgi:hypothetical protein